MAGKISSLYFDSDDYRLLQIVNEVLDKELQATAEADSLLRPYLHPHGIKTLISGSHLRIALAVINLLSSLKRGKAKDRLLALRCLHDEVLSSSGSMRQNTARVLIQIMKTLVRTRGDELEQLKLAHDFRAAASGKPKTVLAQLRKYHLLEMPEEWNQLCFDDRVHDAHTKGRKTPTHLIMDAWIKGIRRLTVVYYHFVDPSVVRELVDAAGIMGVEVHIGVELTAMHRGRFVQLIWEPKGFKTYAETKAFLCGQLAQGFMDNGRMVGGYTQQYVNGLVELFNSTHRHSIARDYGINLEEIDCNAFLLFVGKGQPSVNHLATYIHKQAYPLMKAEVERLSERYSLATTLEEKKDIEDRVDVLENLDPDAFAERYLMPGWNPSLISYVHPSDSAPAFMKLSVPNLIDIIQDIHSVNNFTLNTADLTQADVIELLYACRGRITSIESFSLSDVTRGRFRDGAALGHLQEVLNNGDVVGIKRIIQDNIVTYCLGDDGCEQESDEVTALHEILSDITTFTKMYSVDPLKSHIGSGSTGNYSGSFGMGFVVLETLPARSQKELRVRLFEGKAVCLPIEVEVSEQYNYSAYKPLNSSAEKVMGGLRRLPFLRRWGQTCIKTYVEGSSQVISKGCGNLVMLGGLTENHNNFVLKKRSVNKKPNIPLNYLNSTVLNWLKVLVGFVPAFLTFALTKDWWVLAYLGAFIWFGITGVRNIIQSVVGGGGVSSVRKLSLLKWKSYVNWSRVTDSLLWTGFSVPLLDYLCKTLLLDQGFGITTSTSPVLLYSIMGVTNGIYIYGHNVFRGLPQSAAFWNLFRSILSIPVALLFNWIIGSFLGVLGVIGVELILQKWAAVISKLASDCVAGIIEGNADRGVNVHMRVWDYQGKMRQLMGLVSKVEMLFPEHRFVEMMANPSEFIEQLNIRKKGYVQACIFDSLDFLCFWCYQPRAITGLRYVMRNSSEEERAIFFMSQLILREEKEVARILVEGEIGSQFGRALSFYLDNYQRYLHNLDLMLCELGSVEHRKYAGDNWQDNGCMQHWARFK